MEVSVTGRRRTAVVAGVAAVVAVVTAPAASALSCAGHPEASPQAIATGTERLSVDGSFRDHYDGAVLGTVRSATTQDDGQHPEYGRTELVVEVTGALGPAVGRRAVVVQDDPGWLQGYPFEVGSHYFIPYLRTEAGLYSHVCDPVAEVDPAEVPALLDAAAQGPWTATAPDDVRPSPDTSVASGMLSPWIPVATVAVGALSALAWVGRRRRVSGHHVDPRW